MENKSAMLGNAHDLFFFIILMLKELTSPSIL